MPKKKQLVKGSSTLDRKSANRQPRESILIICQSRQTEPNYFNTLRKQYRLSSVQVKTGEGGSTYAPLADEEKLREWSIEYDQIWYVFDTENLSEQSNKDALRKALETTEKYNIKLCYSNPCFEYWVLLHFRYTDKPLPDATNVLKELKQAVLNYEKNMRIFAKLEPNTTIAIRNAKKCRKSHELLHGNVGCTNNPCTNVDELVEKLIALAEY